MAEEKPSVPLNIVLYKDGDYWIGRCIEFDVMTSGIDEDRVREDAINICSAQWLFAFKNGFLGNLFRPPNTVASLIMLKSVERGAGATIQTRTIDHRQVRFHLYSEAA